MYAVVDVYYPVRYRYVMRVSVSLCAFSNFVCNLVFGCSIKPLPSVVTLIIYYHYFAKQYRQRYICVSLFLPFNPTDVFALIEHFDVEFNHVDRDHVSHIYSLSSHIFTLSLSPSVWVCRLSSFFISCIFLSNITLLVSRCIS